MGLNTRDYERVGGAKVWTCFSIATSLRMLFDDSFDKFDHKGAAFVWNHRGRRGWWRGGVLWGSEAGSEAKKWFRAEAEVDGE